MPETNLEQLIYAPIPHKGYGIRGKSSGVDQSEFKEAYKDWFCPFEQNLFQGDYEARVSVALPPGRIFLSRSFRKPKLDELGREGIASHVVCVPKEAISDGLPLKKVEEAMIQFDRSGEATLGEISRLRVSWDKQETDPDLVGVTSLIPEEAAKKMVSAFESNNAKVLLFFKRTVWDRIELFFKVSKLLLRCGIKSFTLTSDYPLDVALKSFINVVIITNFLPPIKPGSGWTVVNLSRKEGARERTPAVDVTKALAEIYGP